MLLYLLIISITLILISLIIIVNDYEKNYYDRFFVFGISINIETIRFCFDNKSRLIDYFVIVTNKICNIIIRIANEFLSNLFKNSSRYQIDEKVNVKVKNMVWFGRNINLDSSVKWIFEVNDNNTLSVNRKVLDGNKPIINFFS